MDLTENEGLRVCVYMPISFDMAVLAVMGGPKTVETNSSVSIGTGCDVCEGVVWW